MFYRKETSELLSRRFQQRFGEPRDCETGPEGEADWNTLWEQVVWQFGRSSAHMAMFDGAEGFLKHRQSTASEDLFLPWPPGLFGMMEEEVIHQESRNFS